MQNIELANLKRQFPSAAYSYLHIINLAEQARLFLDGSIPLPDFSYKNYLNAAEMHRRKSRIAEAMSKITEASSREFLERRLRETELLLLIANGPRAEDDYNVRYRGLMSTLYQKPDSSTTASALRYLLRRATETGTASLAEEVAASFSIAPSKDELFMPSADLFNRTRTAFLDLASELRINEADEINHELATRLIKESLVHIGADKKGWTVQKMSHGSNMAVAGAKKQVLIGAHFSPKSNLRLKQVVAHEVYGHVLRALSSESAEKYLQQDEEGIAIVCEQLLAPTYSHKRLIRFLLVSAGWGSDGNTLRTFADVFEIAWRLNSIIGGISEEEAKVRAFHECARVFRGGRVDGGGAIMTKDAVYLTSNLKVWKLMQENETITIQKLLMV